ncbi:hypothetical protein [Pseudorhodoferax sp. Leaf267]|uniref:hypothetical protein n=1 Tax=Pseudorhodoferax sp. Leaf267 TaxID=1736316 RepID=UPI0006F8EEE3|nr:hypothetical protein [Pseudorhodoferax sp. Leaf267]KQP12641.1 hypothetical protein ASF43_20595 [Pseudorhodoferax sp. Leaf267]
MGKREHQETTQVAATGVMAQDMSRRAFTRVFGLQAVLLSSLSLAACGGSDDEPPVEPPVQPPAPTATPIADAPLQPATIGSYQRKNGYFNWSVAVGDASRDIEVYIPAGARQREYWITIAVPDGVRANEFLAKAGWFGIADENTVCLLILKPGSAGAWGDVAAESAYVAAAMATLASSGTHYSAFLYHYAVGYGAGAAPLQLHAARTPLSMISQAYVEAKADAAYSALLSAAGNTQVGQTLQPVHMDFAGAVDIAGNPVTQQRTFAAQYHRDVPIPTWFVGTTAPALLSYWAGVNDADVLPLADSDFGQVFRQNKELSNAIATAGTDVRSQVAVGAAGADVASPQVARNIYRFLTQYSGYDNNSVYGHFITRRLDYKQAIASRNMVVKDHAWSGSPNQQTYIVYVPESVKRAYSATRPAPVVFATHGAGQTAFVFFEATDIKQAAERYGFVAVTYDTTTTPYLTDLVQRVKPDIEGLGVGMDASRLYVYGHSAGGGATTGFARDETLVATFAAFGITSGTFPAATATASNKLVPVYAIYGEYDYWPMKVGPLAAGDFRGSQGGQFALSANVQNYWLNRLIGRTLAEEMAAPTYALTDGIGASLVPQNTPITLLVNPSATVNRYRTFRWSRAGVPLFVWGQNFGRGHNMIPADLNKIWEEWFSKWQRGTAAGTLLYWPDGVGTGAAVTVPQA